MAVRRIRPLAVLVALLLVAGSGLVSASADGPPVSGGAVVAQCQSMQGQAPVGGAQACRSAQAELWGTSAACRLPLSAAPGGPADLPEQCAVIDGRPVSEARVAAYQSTWVHRALSRQRALSAGAPLLEEVIPHTHNSFNTSRYDVPDPTNPSHFPTLTNQDPNQVYSITDQLQMDVRAIEIDVHWVPSPWGPGFEAVACHGTSEAVGGGQHVHVGCTDDQPLASTLHELRAWLDAHPDQFVLVYLENQLDGNPAGHERAGQLLASGLGSRVYQPPVGQPCADMPVHTSAADVLASGAQVLLVGNCDAADGAGTAWGQWVHSRGPTWDEGGDPTGYGPTQCGSDLAERNSASPPFRRYFEEVTWLGTMGDTAPAATSAAGHVTPITADATAQMVRCGVNIIGLDQLTPEDPRLPALVWSWAPNEPAVSGCAYQGGDSRFRSASVCDSSGGARHFACADAAGAWHETVATGTWDQGGAACGAEFAGSTFGVPANGWRNQELFAAKSASADEVWLNYRVTV
jgi:hypothetical protein